jgi:hypothetical protein
MILEDLRNIFVSMRTDFASYFTISCGNCTSSSRRPPYLPNRSASGLRAFRPRPEGRGLTRILVKEYRFAALWSRNWEL